MRYWHLLDRTKSDEQQELSCRSGCGFCPVAPEQNLRLVEALQSKGEIVAMTGDGSTMLSAQTNLGIAMGMAGTEVAQGSSRHDPDHRCNFASIETAVEEGRTVYQNL